MSYDGSLNFDTSIDVKGFEKDASRINKSVKKLGVALAAAFSVRALTRFSKRAIETASDLQEVQNVVDVAFGAMSKDIEEFASTAIENFGLSELSAKRYASTIGQMGASMGFAAEQNVEMATTLTGLIGDFSSFYNVSQERAALALNAVYTGETETLKRYGIVLTQVNLEEFARAQGIQKSIKAMTQQEKVMLRYQFVLDATQNAQGDFVRTQENWANQTRILTQRWQQFLGLIGENLLRVFTPAIRAINTLLASLIAATEQFNAFYASVSGNEINQQSEITSQIESSVDEQENLTGAVEETNKALEGTLAGFDDVNVLQKEAAGTGPITTGGGGGGISAATTGGISTQIDPSGADELSPVFQKLLDILKPLQAIDLTNLDQSLANLGESVGPLTRMAFEGLVFFYNNFLVPITAFTIEMLLPSFFNLLAAALDALLAVLEPLQPLGLWLIDNFLVPIGNWAGSTLVSFIDKLTIALIKFSDWARENEGIIRTTAVTVGVFFGAWKLAQVLAFIQMSGGIIGAFWGIAAAIGGATLAKLIDKAETIALTLVYAGQFLMSIFMGTLAIGAQILAWVGLTAMKVLDLIQTLLINAALLIYNGLTWIAAAATWAFSAAVAFLTSPIGLVVLAIVALIAIIVLLVKNWDKVKEIAGIVWTYIVELWEGFAEFIKTKVVDPVIEFFTELFDTIESVFTLVFDAITEGFKEYINGWLGMIEGFLNFFIQGINGLVRRLNRIDISIPDWVPEIGGKSFGFNLPRASEVNLPRLAQGGVIPPNSEMAVIFGDQRSGNNIEAPESLIRQIVREEGGARETVIKFTGDLAELARILQPEIENESGRQGKGMRVVTE